MAELLKGKPVADAIGAELEPRVRALAAEGVVPTLAIVRVGERSDDLAYERGAMKRCGSLGIEARVLALPGDCSQAELMNAIEAVNEDGGIHGCLMLRPLPGQLDEEAACAALDSDKDVDGITAASLFGVFANQAIGFPPCTAEACMRVLGHYGSGLEGARAVVVGRSMVVGRPVAMMLQAANATVTMCHTRTRDLPAVCREADVLVAAAGHANTVGAAAVRAGQVVVDVGINWDDEAGKLVGDVSFDEVEPLVGAITPVPGGVGAVTTAVLASHVVEAAERGRAR